MDGNASMGHNQGSSFITYEYLSEKHGQLLNRAKSLSDSFARVPLIIDNDELSGKASDFAKQIAICLNDLEGVRKEDKQPHLDNCRVIDGFFKDKADPLTFAKNEILKRQTAYLRKIEAERKAKEEARLKAIAEAQAKAIAEAKANNNAPIMPPAPPPPTEPMKPVAARGDLGSTTSWRRRVEIEITDRASLDLEALRPYFTQDHLFAAIKAAVKAGIKEIRGVEIDTDAVKAVTR